MAKTNGNSKSVTASQSFKTEKVCKHVVRYQPDGKAQVGDREVDEISSSIYIDKRILDALGNPDRVIVTVTAG